jgi:hypothetical protein
MSLWNNPRMMMSSMKDLLVHWDPLNPILTREMKETMKETDCLICLLAETLRQENLQAVGPQVVDLPVVDLPAEDHRAVVALVGEIQLQIMTMFLLENFYTFFPTLLSLLKPWLGMLLRTRISPIANPKSNCPKFSMVLTHGN